MSTTEPKPRLRLIDARTNRRMSQQDVATELGTTHVNVSRWERGITKPGPYFRRKLSALFGKSEQDLDLLPTPAEDDAAPSLTTGSGGAPPGRPATPDDNGSRSAPSPAISAPATPTALYDPVIPLKSNFPLVGRDDDLRLIRQRLLAGGSVALTALNGIPGVGKTALTIAIAHDPAVRTHFRDGILWAGLGPHPNIPGLLSRWGTLLGVSPAQMAAPGDIEAWWARALRTAIGDRKMLLIIDDAWTVEAALTFKVGGPHCAHLVTTRFPSIASHVAYDGAFILRELNDEQGVQLLHNLAPQVVERERGRVQELVQVVGGLPLALTLMGNYLRKQAYTGQARRITAALARLGDARARLNISEPHTLVESHPSLPTTVQISLQSVIAVTEQFLNEQATAQTGEPVSPALYALSIFPPKPASFSEEAALVVTGSSVETLDLLNDAGLLESSGSGRYTLHQTIADYARLQLDEPSAIAARRRLIAYICDFVEEHRKDYELLDMESNVILTALAAAYELGKQRDLLRMVIAFAPFMLLRAWYTQAAEQVQRVYEAAQALGDDDGLISTLLYLGQIAQKQGNFAQAEAHFQQGLHLARQLNDQEHTCTLLTSLGWITWRRGDFARAEAYLQEGLAIARHLNDQERLCDLLKTLGSLENSRGNYGQSEIYLQEGLMLAKQIEDREQIFTLLINLGAAAGEQGNHAQAEAYFQEGLQLARQIGHREGICVLLANLGDAANELGKYSEAEAYFREGLTLTRQIGHREWTSALLINLGLMKRRQKDFVQAEAYLQESLQLSREIGRPQVIANALYEYGNLYIDQQQSEPAKNIFKEMLDVTPEGARELVAQALYGLARVAAIGGNVQEAHRLGHESLTILEAIGHRKAQEVRDWLNSLR
ncbi:MAG: tetratricopeptide repeat protein [Ktedonobacteraceae bacterium]|nr:tetratricopeptide repeat protein [Ktedonobacteraceae bacterium]